jgi:hypothetical protein
MFLTLGTGCARLRGRLSIVALATLVNAFQLLRVTDQVAVYIRYAKF